MAATAAADRIGGLDLFAGARPEDVAALAAAARPRRFSAGATLFQRGDAGAEMFIVLEGRIRLSVLSAEGRELSLRHAETGALIGEMAALDGGARSADATAVTEARVLALARADMDRLLAERPSLARAVVRFLCRRLRDTTDQMESIALYRLEPRLARFLLALARADVEAGRRTARLELALNQSEIADMLGASRPKLNGALAALEAAGAVAREGRALRLQVDTLTAIADGGA
ncbi:transcriptional regulator [Methylopila jiangsuensis]|uniref:Transcriptional regulator n=1 Tax=Methylopila jiangsuensis TaxID=586230 RepID=A0A9W6JJG4_9HYPH|nr:Crp/Fnr family transcriptional regulator [Methylopila jiangsuensis]MDR6285087.1 CRP-like cAMP-binding protein [Methylopila jiangsuensis]GLK77526.1 transcriptional regulator [Methylopila jiangsuensis]